MPDSLPPITPAQRQRLQKLWEEARGLMARAGSPPNRKDAERIHELLARCVSADPGNTVYLDAILTNLRQLRPHYKRWWWSWIPLSIRGGEPDAACWDHSTFEAGLHCVKHCQNDSSMVNAMIWFAHTCAQIDAPQAEIRYLQEALHYAPEDERVLIMLARSLLRQGRFDESRSAVERGIAAANKSSELAKLLVILGNSPSTSSPRKSVSSSAKDILALAAEHVDSGHFDEAEAAAAKALSLSGGNLAVREQVEDISLERLKNNVAIAHRLVEHEPTPAHQQTLRRWEEELGRLELATLHARSERFPQDAGLKLEVAVRLKRAGNYSGAIQRLEEIAADHSLRPSALLELGECWQHLRQFDKALGLYTQAIAAAEELSQPESQKLALYRAGSLASAMQRITEAKACFQRLVALDPNFKDARERLFVLDS